MLRGVQQATAEQVAAGHGCKACDMCMWLSS